MRMEFTPEKFSEHIPYYLTGPEKDGLLKALSTFPRKIDYFINRYMDEVLQGDAWTGVPIIDFGSRQIKAVKAIVLSNSCSVSPENGRALPPKVVVCPLIPLDRYSEKLLAAGLERRAVVDKIEAIKEQRIANIFYLPKGGGLEFEAIAVLDDLHSLPATLLTQPQLGISKLTTLANIGFYLFLFKISIHFCRFHENVSRSDVVGEAVV